jgi:hypothetical protein
MSLYKQLGSGSLGFLKKTGRVLKACGHEAISWCLGDCVVYSTAPALAIACNGVQLASVVGTSIANTLSETNSEKWQKTKKFFTQTINPHVTNTLFYGINGLVALGQWTGLVAGSKSPAEARMKTLYAGLTVAFYGALGAQQSPKIKAWLLKRSKLVQSLMQPEISIAPHIPVFYALPLAGLGEKLGTIGMAGVQMPVLETALWGIAAVTAGNSARNFYLNKNPGFFSRNFGMLNVVALNSLVAAQGFIAGGVQKNLMAAVLIYQFGNIVYLAKDYLRHKKAAAEQVAAKAIGVEIKP